ncbi:MAG: response regulator transcription factor [Bacteriovoracaceae bacterium]
MKSSKSKKRILIVDDHPLFRKGIRAAVTEGNDIEIIGEAGSGEEALSILAKKKVDVVILDYQLPGINGVELSKKIKLIDNNIANILLTMHKEEKIFSNSFEYGIDAYLLKENAVEEVLKAIQVVSDGNYYLSPSMSEYIMNKNIKRNKFKSEHSGIELLTQKEKEILRLIAQYKTTKEIAVSLYVSYKTIENHRANICKKLNITGTNALLKFIIENKDQL